jgi:hypothetical protein
VSQGNPLYNYHDHEMRYREGAKDAKLREEENKI